jgi:drug/metabolite transporter (DMT)-like permease
VRPLPVLTLTLAMLLWSSSFIALKHVLEIWSFGQVLFMRMGGVLLLAALLPPAWPRHLPEGGLALVGPDGGA